MEIPSLFTTPEEAREVCALLRNGLRVTLLSDEVRVRVSEWVLWVEWHHGIMGEGDLSDLPLFTHLQEVGK